jgi:hypothetical protein
MVLTVVGFLGDIMKPIQQRIAIAEACGWKQSPTGWWNHTGVNPVFQKESPNYLNDLNAMLEAEKTLTATQFEWMWLVELPRMLNTKVESFGMDVWKITSPTLLFHATAPQRAEAFLRTLNLWVE